jgi:hypothetical protein
MSEILSLVGFCFAVPALLVVLLSQQRLQARSRILSLAAVAR